MSVVFFDAVDFAETIGSRDVVRLRQGREVEHRGLKVLDRAPLAHDNLVIGFPSKRAMRSVGRGAGGGKGREGICQESTYTP